MRQSIENGEKTYLGTGHLTDSEYYELLAAEQRRKILDILPKASTPIELEELAIAVATRERETDAVEDELVERVALQLHHMDLPKMDDFGVLNYDSVETRVRFDP